MELRGFELRQGTLDSARPLWQPPRDTQDHVWDPAGKLESPYLSALRADKDIMSCAIVPAGGGGCGPGSVVTCIS